MYYFILDGVKSIDKKIQVSTRPSMPSPQKNYDEINLNGRDGKLYIDLGTYDDMTIKLECNYIETNLNEWAKKWRYIKKWLLKEHEFLSFSDDSEYVYKVKKITLSDNDRNIKQSGEFTVSFIVEAYSYLKDGTVEHDLADILVNDHEVSKPVYKIEGVGTCELNINGTQFTITSTNFFNIDTSKQTSYDNNMNSLNDQIDVDYENLYLLEGLNAISVSSGFTLKVIPYWREL